jgi:ABC-2 type transport system ATP-binding protein
MKKLGKKTLTLNLIEPLAALPADLSDWDLTLKNDGGELDLYSFDAQAERHRRAVADPPAGGAASASRI